MSLIRFLLFLFFWQNAFADSPPPEPTKFEWGAGFLSIYGNHYRGSDQQKVWLFPMPYFTYRSERLEAEPTYIRGVFIHNKWFSFKLSLMLGLNVESKKNYARSDMPSLDYTFEAGPMFIFHLWASDDNIWKVNFETPIRGIFATDLSYVRYVGLFTVPYVNVIHAPTASSWNWGSEFSVSPMFADQKYHQHFYGVDQQFVRSDRPAYRAHGGYSGFQTAMVLNKRAGQMEIIPFVRWDYLKGAIFESSPLVKRKNYFIGGLGLFWIFD